MRSFLIAALLCFAALIPSQRLTAADPNEFLEYNYLDSGNNLLLPGRLYVPASYATTPQKFRPLILFLHGGGEWGTDNISQVNGNIDGLLAGAKARDAFLYAPQTHTGWSNTTVFDYTMSMIDRAISERSVDTNRIYVTGISMGGGGAWNFLNQFPDRVAATVPIAGVTPVPGFDYNRLLNEPIWAFHGRRDTTVPATVTRDVINNFLTLAGIPIPTYPELNTFGVDIKYDFPPLDLHYTDHRLTHVIWDRVYTTPALYDWMFAHGVVPEPNTAALLLVAGSIILARRSRKRTC